MKATIEVISKDNRADTPFNIIVSHLEKDTLYTIEMELHHFYCINAPMTLSTSMPWCSSGEFISDSTGKIDLTKTKSKWNTSEGGAAMGLFFNARPKFTKRMKLKDSLADIPEHRCYQVVIRCLKDSKIVVRTHFTRYYLDLGLSSRNIIERDFQGRLFYDSKSSYSKPAIIVVSGSDGRIEKAQNIAQLLANRGYVTLAVAYFGLNGLPRDLNKIPLESIISAKHYLLDLPFVDKNNIGLYGRSKGAELVLTAESKQNTVKAIALNSPTHVNFEGIKGKMNSKSSSWTYQGAELLYHKFSYREFLSKVIFKRKLKINSCEKIDISKIKSSLFILASKNYEIWDAYESAIEISSRYVGQKLDIKYYNNTGHMLTVAYQPNSRYSNNWENILGESIDSWEETITFFDRELKN
ncbi:alpha/beta hydrolase [Streptococcus agalactiae]|uniref:alpha/beta hydrolase n=1 Tax=Streptococcus agalactiae TaxID=1311 RepID=UPI003FA6DF73